MVIGIADFQPGTKFHFLSSHSGYELAAIIWMRLGLAYMVKHQYQSAHDAFTHALAKDWPAWYYETFKDWKPRPHTWRRNMAELNVELVKRGLAKAN